MTAYIAAGLASFVFIALKALQQRQVMHAQYLRMPPVSMAMSYSEVFIFANVIHTADSFSGLFILATCIGIGGSLGGMLGTWLHARRHG